MLTLLGKKLEQTQKFLEDGTRIPVTVLSTPGNTVLMTKTHDKDGYFAVQLGIGQRKNAHLDKAPLFIKEARLSEKEAGSMPQVGDVVEAAMVLAAGDMVNVQGHSKGKGFADRKSVV